MTDPIKTMDCADSVFFSKITQDMFCDPSLAEPWDDVRAFCVSRRKAKQEMRVQPETSSISAVNVSEKTKSKSFRLDGTLAKADAKGIVIQKGKQTLRK